MVTRSFAAIGALAAALVLVSDDALARSGGVGAGAFAAHGFSGFGAKSFRHAPVLRRGGSFRHLNAFARRPLWRFGLYQWPWIFPSDAFYGADGLPGDDPSAADTGLSPMPLALYRPSCRLQTQSVVVATADGGERRIAITRCLVPLGLAAQGSDEGRLRAIAGEAETGGTGSPLAAAVSGEAPADSGRLDGRTCRVQTVIVASEDGGERTITVHRC